MTPNKIISHFHNYLCILIVLKKLLLYVILVQKYKKYVRNQTLFIKCSFYKSPKKKKGKVQYSDVGPQYYKRCCIIHVLAAIQTLQQYCLLRLTNCSLSVNKAMSKACIANDSNFRLVNSADKYQ